MKKSIYLLIIVLGMVLASCQKTEESGDIQYKEFNFYTEVSEGNWVINPECPVKMTRHWLNDNKKWNFLKAYYKDGFTWCSMQQFDTVYTLPDRIDKLENGYIFNDKRHTSYSWAYRYKDYAIFLYYDGHDPFNYSHTIIQTKDNSPIEPYYNDLRLLIFPTAREGGQMDTTFKLF